MRLKLGAAAIFFLATAAPAARRSQTAEHAFQAYVATVEARLARQHSAPETYLAVRTAAPGEMRIEGVNGGTWEVPGGLLHHWRGSAFVPDADATDMLALLRDYDRLARYYTPEVVSSRALKVTGEDAQIVMRFRKHRVVTVVLDAEFQTHAALAGAGRGYNWSRSTHVWQIDNPGTPSERRRPEGDDDGFLWALNSYWSFEETRGGLLIECEAVSLTRDVPTGLGWLITPIIQDLPKASLEFTLTATRNALAANTRRSHDDYGAR